MTIMCYKCRKPLVKTGIHHSKCEKCNFEIFEVGDW